MKPSILVATQKGQIRTSLRSGLAGICEVSAVGASGKLLTTLRSRDFEALVLDARLPGLDGQGLLHALHHRPHPNMLLVSGGSLDPDTLVGAQTVARLVSLPSLSVRPILGVLRAAFDPASARSIQWVRYERDERRFFVAFRNGKFYELSRRLIEADDPTDDILGEPQVIYDGEAFRVRQASGNEYEVAWDFVLYHQEPDYEYHKGKASQKEAEANRAERIGARVRQEREARGWSLGDLARQTGMHPPNLSRLENGKHVPSLETMERVGEALGVRVADLVAV
jgi:DNA-binding Xre family transcriptional regulator/CheY-like chemotaxis protein